MGIAQSVPTWSNPWVISVALKEHAVAFNPGVHFFALLTPGVEKSGLVTPKAVNDFVAHKPTQNANDRNPLTQRKATLYMPTCQMPTRSSSSATIQCRRAAAKVLNVTGAMIKKHAMSPPRTQTWGLWQPQPFPMAARDLILCQIYKIGCQIYAPRVIHTQRKNVVAEVQKLISNCDSMRVEKESSAAIIVSAVIHPSKRGLAIGQGVVSWWRWQFYASNGATAAFVGPWCWHSW